MNEKLWGFTKKSNFGGGGSPKTMHRGELPTKELGQCVDLREAWQRGGWCF